MLDKDLVELVSFYPESFIRAYMSLLDAALYFQEISTWTDEERKAVDSGHFDHYSLIVTRSCKLSSLLTQKRTEEDYHEVSPCD